MSAFAISNLRANNPFTSRSRVPLKVWMTLTSFKSHAVIKFRSIVGCDVTALLQIGIGLPRSARVRFDLLRFSVRKFQSFMHKWVPSPTSICECSASNHSPCDFGMPIISCPQRISWIVSPG